MTVTLVQSDGTALILPRSAQRVVSLVPSITENLIQFGVTPVGRTSFCIEPKDRVKSIPVVGGTKTPKIPRILNLNPDLVIANKEENRREDVEALIKAGCTVWVTYPTRVKDVPPFMNDLAKACGVLNPTTSEIILECEKEIEESGSTPQERRSVIALIWKDPWMAVGGGTYTNDLIRVSGGENPFAGGDNRYPATSEEEIAHLRPDLLLLPSEPFAFSEEHVEWWRKRFQSERIATRVERFSGEDLSWFGPRLKNALPILRRLIAS